jgi:hypothetical protein
VAPVMTIDICSCSFGDCGIGRGDSRLTCGNRGAARSLPVGEWALGSAVHTWK